jgi:outer membrane protein assembly factor BamB
MVFLLATMRAVLFSFERGNRDAILAARGTISTSATHGGGLWTLALLLAAVGWLGCRPPVEQAPGAVPLAIAASDPAEDGVAIDRWPGWRGRNGSGIAPGGSPPISFGPTGGYRWKIEVPGEGNSSPVVWDEWVFLTTALDTTDPPTLAILGFRRSDGRLLWQTEVGPARGRTHPKNGYASATVATDGERVFAFFGTTGLFCCDLAGDVLWHAELGDLGHKYGTASSPVLYRDSVIQLCDSENDSYLAAFDKRSGKPIWRTPRPSYACWSTPVLIEARTDSGPRTELVVNGTGSRSRDGRMVIAYDPADGRELWRVRGTTELVAPTPLVSGGLVYSTSGRGGPIIAIRPGGSGDVTQSRVVWKIPREGPYIPSGVAYRNRLFLVGDSRQLVCYNAGSGEPIWTERLRGTFSASLVAADGRIYATSEQGVVYVFRAADSFELLAQNDLDERCIATPAVAGGELLIRTEEHLYCIPGREAGGPKRLAGGAE